MGGKFQDQFLGIAAINVSLQGEHSQQKSLNIGYSDPPVQYHSDKYISDTYGEDKKMHAASQQNPEDKQNESTVGEYSYAATPRGDADNANASPLCDAPLLEETVSAGDYETSLLDDRSALPWKETICTKVCSESQSRRWDLEMCWDKN